MISPRKRQRPVALVQPSPTRSLEPQRIVAAPEHPRGPVREPRPESQWGQLPARMRVLFITGPHRTGGWLAEAFAADSASDVALEELAGMAAGLARLRDEPFDAVLISHEGVGLDALHVLDAIRAGSCDELPILVLGEQSEQEMAALCYEAGGDCYACVNTTTTRTLIWEVARAVERHAMILDNRRLRVEQRRRLQLEHEEAARLLQQQRSMIADLAGLARRDKNAPDAERTEAPSSGCPDLPEPLLVHYRELLRAFVIMGSGNLGDEMRRLAELLAAASVTSQQAMLLHLHVLEEVVRGLGNRSARHVMNRADMLILEVMIILAECYRGRLLDRISPPRQQSLPGFE